MNRIVVRFVLIVALFLLSVAGCKSPGTTPNEAATEERSATAETSPKVTSSAETTGLQFAIDKGQLSNRLVRQGDIAAHALTRSGKDPRIIAAFPAGNSGAGIWFEPTDQPVDVGFEAKPEPLRREEGLRGVSFAVTADADELAIEKAVHSSVRVLRNYMHQRELPDAYEQSVEVAADHVRWTRDAVDGETRYVTSLKAFRDQARFEKTDDGIVVRPGNKEKPITFVVEAANDEPPLTPIAKEQLVTDDAADKSQMLDALAFLSYEEKLLAGSWRFLTYFGRDTLLSVRLLMPVLKPAAVEAGIGSVLERLSKDGQVAHEEDIGEFAAFENAVNKDAPSRKPSYDYDNIDDNLMLAPVAARYLLDNERGQARAEQFLKEETPRGRSYRDALRANIDFVLRRAKPYAEDPKIENLISLRKGHGDGEWRDSAEGLGNARIPYDVNVALMPAALESAARLLESDLYANKKAAAAARDMLEKWRKTYDVFEVEIPAKKARDEVETYAESLGLDAEAILDTTSEDSVVFPSLALDEKGNPIRVMHSDDGYALLFGEPSAERLEGTARRINQPFPVGLKTDVGFVVANAAYAGERLEKMFTRNHYHGATIWSWQQAMMAEGIARQLRRDDLPKSTRSALKSAQKTLWQLIENSRDVAKEELWSWSYDDGKYRVVPFGQQSGDITESNAVQLWSTVYLAVQPPE